MDITITFFLGLGLAIIAVIPPGLLNMTAAKISLKEGPVRGIVFSIGVCVIVITQVYIALSFAKYISKHPDIIGVLQRVAFVIFVLITIYFLLIAKKEPKRDVEINIKSKKSRFFQGMFLSALNVFPIPYQAYMGLTFSAFGILTLDNTGITSYTAGATMGTFVVLYAYIFFFDKIKSKKMKSQKTMNLLIGLITGVISIITLIKILK